MAKQHTSAGHLTLIQPDGLAAQPPAVQAEYRLDRVLEQLDELCAMALRPETADAVAAQRVLVGQAVVRAQLLASFLMARTPRGFGTTHSRGL